MRESTRSGAMPHVPLGRYRRYERVAVSGYMRKALKAAGIERPLRPWHDLRHTALTHDAAAGNPAVYVQARAGDAQASMTERYVHAARVAFHGVAERAEDRVFAGVADD